MKNNVLKFVLFLFLIQFASCQKEKKADENIIPTNNVASFEKKIDTINWYTELCDMKSEFDAKKYTKKQLKDTHTLWFSTGGYIDFDGYPVFKLDEKTEPIEVLEQKYADSKSYLENLEIVDLPYWKKLKKLKLEELKSYYDHERTAFFAYSNLSLLKNTNYLPKAKIYVDALISGDSLKMISAWKLLNEEQKAKNGSPENVEIRFQNKLNSPDNLEYAKMDLFSFGWSNNVTKSCDDCKFLQETGEMFEEYKKLFISTTEECSEP